jgi:hypothetical protein
VSPKKSTKPLPPRRSPGGVRSLALRLVLLVAWPGLLFGQSRFELQLSNPAVAVFSLALPGPGRAAFFQNTRDVVLIGLQHSSITLIANDGNRQLVSLWPGDARFLPRNQFKSLFNENTNVFTGVVVEIKARPSDPQSCGCGAEVEKIVCGCASRPLPGLWAFATDAVTLAGTTLQTNEVWKGSAKRGDTLLVAITSAQLQEDTAAATRRLDLIPGQAEWIAGGLHQFRNLGKRPARFVTIEF